MDSCLRSPSLSQVYLSLTFHHTAVAKVEMSSTFPTIAIKLNNSVIIFQSKINACSESQRELAIVLSYPFDSDLSYHFRQGWKHV